MSPATMELEQKQVLETEIAPIIQKAKALVVKSPEQRIAAVKFADGIDDVKEKIEERFHPTINREKALQIWKDLKDTENAFYEPLDEAKKIIKDTVKAYDREVALKQQKEAELAEAKRLEEERKERERLQKLADAAAAKGKTEKAEALALQAESVTIAPTFNPAPQASKKLIWKARVTNMMWACKSIGDGLIPFNAVEFKQSALNELGKAYDGQSKIAGIEFYQDVNARI